MEWNYQTIKEIAKSNKITIGELLGMHSSNDPFYDGTPKDWELGEWFANIWNTMGFGEGVHLRRVHYKLLSYDITMVDGMPYENTQRCWDHLMWASMKARNLGLVDPFVLKDQRTGDPFIQRPFYDDANYIRSSFIEADASGFGMTRFPDMPSYEVEGELEQQFVVEVWAEKSTMNDVLLPLCRRYGVNYVPGIGEMTLTACCNLVQRIETHGRPFRVFYISDFDTGGDSMPIAVSRKVEFLLYKHNIDVDVRIDHIILNDDQCVEYSLPTIPLKPKDKRKESFKKRHGVEGGVELDALEALHPGVLKSVVERHISQYYQKDLQRRLDRKIRDKQNSMDESSDIIINEWGDEIEELREQYDNIRKEVGPKVKEIRTRLDDIFSEMNAEMEDEVTDVDYSLEDEELHGLYEWPEESEEFLFDSDREYMAQLKHYKRFRREREPKMIRIKLPKDDDIGIPLEEE